MTSSNSLACITVLYFAAASTAIGLTEELISIPSQGFFLSQLTDLLVSRHSESKGAGNRKESALREILSSSQWSVDAEMVENEDVGKVELRDGMEIAVICPVSGG
ncbi:hypothetical protein BDP27DRAFT_1325906 [Rhodocollybia butyracea]|uniref:Molybdopterin synthase sulfur carrier subunit n=1 Tax=Rhodocollybia butyracea TaxID=206335 RepID=A0A9P5PNP5_9AGAR|nr:hypothetical protein BDP27DRAFT_1325906 [Rhodocollybia butyracea]